MAFSFQGARHSVTPGSLPENRTGWPSAALCERPRGMSPAGRLQELFLQDFFLLRRKEVIHPLVLEGIPCFDLTPITGPALDAVPLAVGQTLSGLAGSHGVTGSVYKARERIHRGSADPRLLAIPASRSRIADSDPN